MTSKVLGHDEPFKTLAIMNFEGPAMREPGNDCILVFAVCHSSVGIVQNLVELEWKLKLK